MNDKDINQELLSKLDSLESEFYKAFCTDFTDLQTKVFYKDRLELTIPAVTKEVGDIHIWLDGDEVTVGIGEHFHCHFDTYPNGPTDPTARREAIENTICFLKDLFKGEVILAISKQDDKVTGSGIFGKASIEDIGGFFSKGHKIYTYTWSGRLE